MLQIGDKVVYPMHGAGVISGIENCEVLGEGKSYYVLEMPLGNMKVMIPTDNADNVGLRDVIPQQKVDEVREVLEEEPEKPKGSWTGSLLSFLKMRLHIEHANLSFDKSKQSRVY